MLQRMFACACTEYKKPHILNNEQPTVHIVKSMQQQHGATF
jgi:hypothetical protein